MSHDVTLTGNLSYLTSRTDHGVDATLTHPEVQVHLVFPADVHTQYADLIADGAQVTVCGDYAGPAIRVAEVTG